MAGAGQSRGLINPPPFYNPASRPVVPLLVAIQLYLQKQVFDVHIVAFRQQHGDHGFQGFLIVG
jgi:hypothetical protein